MPVSQLHSRVTTLWACVWKMPQTGATWGNDIKPKWPLPYFFGGTLVKIFICQDTNNKPQGRNFSLGMKTREGKLSVATGRNSKSRHMYACISEPQRPTSACKKRLPVARYESVAHMNKGKETAEVCVNSYRRIFTLPSPEWPLVCKGRDKAHSVNSCWADFCEWNHCLLLSFSSGLLSKQQKLIPGPLTYTEHRREAEPSLRKP